MIEVALDENTACPTSSTRNQQNDDDRPTCTREHSCAASEKSKRRYIVSFYFIALALLHADYNLLAPNLTQVAEEFGMSNNERDVKLGGEILFHLHIFIRPFV